jgi:hypothetical protein
MPTKKILLSLVVVFSYFFVNFDCATCQTLIKNKLINEFEQKNYCITDVIYISPYYFFTSLNSILKCNDSIINEFFFNEDSEGDINQYRSINCFENYKFYQNPKIWHNKDEIWTIPTCIKEKNNNVLLKIKDNLVFNFKIDFIKDSTTKSIERILFDINQNPIVLIDCAIMKNGNLLHYYEIYRFEEGKFILENNSSLNDGDKIKDFFIFNNIEYVISEKVINDNKILSLRSYKEDIKHILINESEVYHFSPHTYNYKDSLLLVFNISENYDEVFYWDGKYNKGVFSYKKPTAFKTRDIFLNNNLYGICKGGVYIYYISQKSSLLVPLDSHALKSNLLLSSGNIKHINNNIWCIFAKAILPIKDSTSNVFLLKE